MRAIIIGLIIAAVVLAGGAAYLVNNYLSSQSAEIASQAPKLDMTSILVANANLPIGTEINNTNVTWTGWPEDGVEDGYIVEDSDKDRLQELEDKKMIVRYGIQKGEPIVIDRLFKRDSPGFLKATLGPGMRAIPVRVSPETATSGFILPGDRVDIILTHKLLERAKAQANIRTEKGDLTILDYVTEIILEDVRVLAIDQKTNQFEGGVAIGGLMLMEVSRKDAEKLITAKTMGTLSVLLRSIEPGTERPNGASVGFTTDIEVSPLLSNLEAALNAKSQGAEAAPAPAPAPAAATTTTTEPAPVPRVIYQPSPKPSGGKITIYRGSSAAGGN